MRCLTLRFMLALCPPERWCFKGIVRTKWRLSIDTILHIHTHAHTLAFVNTHARFEKLANQVKKSLGGSNSISYSRKRMIWRYRHERSVFVFLRHNYFRLYIWYNGADILRKRRSRSVLSAQNAVPSPKKQQNRKDVIVILFTIYILFASLCTLFNLCHTSTTMCLICVGARVVLGVECR